MGFRQIIMLNLTKEGIVVQFLPEAKDFGVSLNQAIMKARSINKIMK